MSSTPTPRGPRGPRSATSGSGQVLEVLRLHHEREAVAHVEAVEAEEPRVLLDAGLDELDGFRLALLPGRGAAGHLLELGQARHRQAEMVHAGRGHWLVVGDEVQQILVAWGPPQQAPPSAG